MKLNPENPNHLIDLDQIKVCKTLSELTNQKVTPEMLLSLARTLNVKKTLLKISVIAAQFEEKNIYHDEQIIVTRENLSFLAKCIALEGNITGGKDPTNEEMTRLCLIVNDFDQDLTGQRDDLPRLLSEYFIRKAHFASLSAPFGYAFPRTVLMFDELGEKYKDKTEINIPLEFKAITGLTVREHVYAGMALTTLFQKGGVITRDSFVAAVTKHSAPTISRFLLNNSITVEQLRRKAFKSTNIYEFNPLLTFPLIQLSETEYICPFLPFLFDRITRGVYYILFDAHKERFARSFGFIFEKYVGSILAPFYPVESIFPERSYFKNGEKIETIDWGIKEGHWLTLLECKTKRLRQRETKTTGSLQELDKDLENGVVDGLIALHRQIEDMKKQRSDFPEYKDVFHVSPVVVLIDRLYFATSPVIKRRIDKLLKEKAGIVSFEYEVIDVEELEMILPVATTTGKRKTLRGFIEKKQNDGIFRHDSFWNYLCNRYSFHLKVHKELKKQFDLIGDEAKRYLFGSVSS